jgi:ABC-type transport system substrate-binding protein
VQNGGWRINEDASMDMTWRLVPDVKWHDGETVDALVRRLQLAIDTAQRTAFHKELLRAETSDVAFMPLYWEVQPSYLGKGITPSEGGLQNLTNFVRWIRS